MFDSFLKIPVLVLVTFRSLEWQICQFQKHSGITEFLILDHCALKLRFFADLHNRKLQWSKACHYSKLELHLGVYLQSERKRKKLY